MLNQYQIYSLIPIALIEPSINKLVILSNVNIVKVTGFTKVKAEQFKCTDERNNAGGGVEG